MSLYSIRRRRHDQIKKREEAAGMVETEQTSKRHNFQNQNKPIISRTKIIVSGLDKDIILTWALNNWDGSYIVINTDLLDYTAIEAAILKKEEKAILVGFNVLRNLNIFISKYPITELNIVEKFIWIPTLEREPDNIVEQDRIDKQHKYCEKLDLAFMLLDSESETLSVDELLDLN